jgi:hypothetical protein
MFQRCFAGVVVLFCLSLTGCADSHDSLLNDTISMMNNALTDVENGVPEEQLKTKYEAQAKSIQERAKKLGKPSEAEQKRLAEKMMAELKKLQPRIQKVSEKTGKKIPNFAPAGF